VIGIVLHNNLIHFGSPASTAFRSASRPTAVALTASTTSHVQKYHPRPTGQLLGHRPKDYIFNLADYAAYTTLRDSYLLSHPHAHAAMCAGGIIACLAREEMSHVTALSSGPSEAALNGEQRILTSDGDHFCDDEISDQVMDLICGVYEVETGNKGKATSFIFTSSPVISFQIKFLLLCGFLGKLYGLALDSAWVNGLISVKNGIQIEYLPFNMALHLLPNSNGVHRYAIHGRDNLYIT